MSRFAKQFLLAGFTVFSLVGAVANASAQQSSCQDIQKMLDERKGLVEQLNKASAKKKQLDPQVACNVFKKLETNGTTTSKWFEANQAWCQIPDDFIQGFKKDHDQVSKLRVQACKAAAQMEAARKQAQEGGGNPAWGGGISGQYRMPKGAL
ncbi:hypothetical protein WJT86_04625 [Microvirga sp. W0021]|uniref:Uncharacterized protein n=1 Tax=Hohaiivirga grylli TaxID=3133970 RepID=A0ABV0BJ97_9HYPH